MSMIDLKTLTADELKEFVAAEGLPSYRAAQLVRWIYEHRAASIDEISEFSKPLRAKLSAKAYIGSLILLGKQTSADGTIKYLFGLQDGQSVESVLIPDDERLTLCVSSQAGCRMGCRFCITGSLGFKRNLTSSEITDQFICVSRDINRDITVTGAGWTGASGTADNATDKFTGGASPKNDLAPQSGRAVTNIVFMGMGEPLDNLGEVCKSLHALTGMAGFSKRRITVSTAGLAPKISELFKLAPEINLAVSLNATTDEVRSAIMPINKTYNIRLLLDACRALKISPNRRITFEYVLLGGVNDTAQDARRLKGLLHGLPAKINLIPYNSCAAVVAESEFAPPRHEDVLKFQEILGDAHLTVIIRKSKGADISAACGQLRAGYGG
jgi:23S rRNA (adenine2503-C2)-methyltransferase